MNPAAALVTAMAAATIVLVALSLRREPPAAFTVTTPAPREVGAVLDGPHTVTVDATDPGSWNVPLVSSGSSLRIEGGVKIGPRM